MIIFAKITNNKIEYASKNYNNICNFDEDIEAMTREGFVGYPHETIANYNIGKLKIENNKIVNNPEYQIKIEQEEFKRQALKTITKRQLLIWLFIKKGKTEDDILTAINTIQDTSQKYLAKINYSGTNNFYYSNDFVPIIGQALGLTLDDIKTMFNEASSL